MAPHFIPIPQYTPAPITTVLSHHHHALPPPQQQNLHQQNPFTYSHYQPTTNNNAVTPFANTYIQPRPIPNFPLTSDNHIRGTTFNRPFRQGFVIEATQNQSPTDKNEITWNHASELANPTSISARTSSPPPSKKVVSEAIFGTEVDTLMKAIQSKASNQPQTVVQGSKSGSGVGLIPTSCQPIKNYNTETLNHSKLTQYGSQDESGKPKTKKRYQCNIEGCSKSFFQKTHLDIHERAHTGVKPYSCKQAGCNRTFSQLGNLKTHERRHTGERPYQCDTCGKRFAQRGNVRAHRIVHDQAKPYVCILDECGKQFTQLGNLKSHQNKFHINTLRALTKRWASVQDGDSVPAADKELWEYFAKLYKNSNKGIKGRGKDRKVGSSHAFAGGRGMSINRSDGFGVCGPGRGNMVVNFNLNVATHNFGRPNGNTTYSMYDDEISNGGSGSSGDGSVGTCYEETSSESFDESNRTGHITFGERIYQGSIGC